MRFLAFAVAAALTACSNDTFVGADGSTGGDGSVTPDGPLPEAGGGDACVPAPTQCAVGSLCTSFDDGTIGKFSDISSGGSATVTSTNYVTCPLALAAATDNQSASPAGAINGQLTAIGNATDGWEAVVDTDILLPNDLPADTSVLDVHIDNDMTSVVTVDYVSGSTYAVISRASADQQTFTPLVGQWGHMKLDVVFSGSGGTGHVSLDYTDSPNHSNNVGFNTNTIGGGSGSVAFIETAIGVRRLTMGMTPTPVYYDDVVFGAK